MKSLFLLKMTLLFCLACGGGGGEEVSESNEIESTKEEIVEQTIQDVEEIVVEAVDITPTFKSAGNYMYIDVSEGSKAKSYSVTYSDQAPDLLASDNLKYKTEIIVLREIPAGNFWMGSPEEESGRSARREELHLVQISTPFYTGIFSVTGNIWINVMGNDPYVNLLNLPNFVKDYMLKSPVYDTSWNDIRGGKGSDGKYDWPSSGNMAREGSFLGVLRSKTGLNLDLPTEAQWEYACRAGTTTAFHYGNTFDKSQMSTSNSEVGRFTPPNAWGLYGMNGGRSEWCLDWYAENISESHYDPVGPVSGDNKVHKGGSFGAFDANGSGGYSRSAFRGDSQSSTKTSSIGFRLFCNP